MIKRVLLFFWNHFVSMQIVLQQRHLYRRDARYIRTHTPPQIMTIDETIDYVVQNRLSVGRFGDGEIKLIAGRNISFQPHSSRITSDLISVLESNDSGFLVCIPDIFADRSYLMDDPAAHWKKHLSAFRPVWYAHLQSERVYGNAFLSRCYMQLRNKSRCPDYFCALKKIWDGQEILLVEGEKSRLGVGNDLFDNALSIQRILGPVENAYSKYDALLNAAKTYGQNKLILLALGPSATVMSYALFRDGFHAIDIGHADIEYEWYLMNATAKVPIQNKYVNEAGAGENVGTLEDKTYQDQILLTIT